MKLHETIEALNVLKGKGYQRIGLCSLHSVMDRLGLDRMGAFRAWTAEQVCSHRVPPCIDAGEGRELLAWLRSSKPDAVFTNLAYVAELIKGTGEDIAVFRCEAGFRPMSEEGLCQHGRQVASAAVDLVAAQLSRNEYGLPKLLHTTLIESRWVSI